MKRISDRIRKSRSVLAAVLGLSLVSVLALDTGAHARGKKHEKDAKEAVSEVQSKAKDTQVRARDAHGRFMSKKKQSAGEAGRDALALPGQRAARRSGSAESTRSGFHCLGIGTGHHTKGMTEADCLRIGGRVEH